MTQTPPISVIIPTHRRPHLLHRAAESVATQTKTPREVIVVEDEPLDDSVVNLIKDMKICSPMDWIYLPSRGGACRARNAGLTAARSDLIAFLDDDDYWESMFLELTGARMVRPPHVDVVITGVRLIGSRGMTLIPAKWYGLETCYLRNGGLCNKNALLRTDKLRRTGGFDPRLRSAQDRDLQIRLIQDGWKADTVPFPLAVTDQSHSEPRISSTDAYADGLLAFARKHSRNAPREIRREMWIAAFEAQHSSSKITRRLIRRIRRSAYFLSDHIRRIIHLFRRTP